MSGYLIKKISNGEFKEIDRSFELDTHSYRSDRGTLEFKMEGEENPVCFDVSVFVSMMVSRIQEGLVEAMKYEDGVIKITYRNGNEVYNDTYDFKWEEFDSVLNGSAVKELKTIILKVVSVYNENPNKAIINEKKYLRIIMDILDGERIPIYEDKEEVLRIFEVYNKDKVAILLTLLNNVIFYDDKGTVLEFGKHLKTRKLKEIKYDVLKRMETSMMMFAVRNEALDLYQEYMASIYMPTVEIVYKYVDENGNEVEPPSQGMERGTILSIGKEIAKNTFRGAKKLALNGIQRIGEKIEERKRTK